MTQIRAIARAAATLAALLILGCGGGGGGGGAASSSAPTASISASPTSVSAGGLGTLTWAATNVNNCNALGAWFGSVNQTGSKSIGPLFATSAFSLSCSGPNGSASASANVRVNVTSGQVPLTHTILANGIGAWAKAFANLDGDARLDVVVSGGSVLSEGIYWYRGSDNQRFQISATGGGEDLHVVDVNNDGLPDVIGAGGLAWYQNPGLTQVTGLWTVHPIDSALTAHEIVSADMNNDGLVDIVAQAAVGGAITVYLQNPLDVWTAVTVLSTASLGLALAKIDSDNNTDIVGNGFWLRNPGNPTTLPWQSTTIDASAPGAPGGSSVQAADLNGDGRVDVVFAPSEVGSGKLVWYEAPINPAISANWIRHELLDVVNVHAMRIADMDKDGKRDIVFAEMFTSQTPELRIGILSNNGTGTWPLQVVTNTGSHNLDIGDVDNDGWLDIVGSVQVTDSPDGGALSIWFGGRN